MDSTVQWNIDLCLGYRQQVLVPLVPFHYFVKPKPPRSSRTSRRVFLFLRLPVDIQLIIYEQCDAPTLFHLMHTCSRTRGPAAKIFWANASTEYWYHTGRSALFEYWPSSHVVVEHCPEFAQYITRIEIDFIRLELHFGREGQHQNFTHRARANTMTKAQDFWAKVNRFFPAIESIVLTGCTPRTFPPPQGVEPNKDYVTIQTVVNCAPPHIMVQIAFFDFHAKPPQYTLWKIGKGQQPEWQALDEDWRPTRVLLPNRKWPASPLGDLVTLIWRSTDLYLDINGLQWLKIESYARYAINSEIHCPRLDCAATFHQKHLWSQHLSESRYDRFERANTKKDQMLELLCYKHTPEAEKIAIEARQKFVDRYIQELEKLNRKIGYGWGPPGSKQRQLFEEELAAQLQEENSFALGNLPQTLDGPLGNYEDILYMSYDQRHGYHGCPGPDASPDEKHICYGWEDEFFYLEDDNSIMHQL